MRWDEHLAGFCTEITVTLEADWILYRKRQRPREFPVEMHKKGVSAERVVLSTLHAGGKFDNNSYKTSADFQASVLPVVNACRTDEGQISGMEKYIIR